MLVVRHLVASLCVHIFICVCRLTAVSVVSLADMMCTM